MLLPQRQTVCKVLCLLILGSIPFFSSLSVTEAGALSEATVRLNRLSPGSPVTGIVCAKPSAGGAGTEGRIGIAFPTDFTISSTASNWSTGTSGLPSGTTPWPGISANAIQASGTTVTFGSSDLTTTNTYCFTFQGASSTVGSGGLRNGTLTTSTGGNTVIDTKIYGMTVTDDQISVRATVPANPTDFTASIVKITAGDTHAQNEEIEYEITYGSLLSYTTTSVTVEAEWGLGTVQGSGIPTVNTVDYVLGSGEDAHNNTPPVIDLASRKIRWEIGSFPGNTTKKVRFMLKTNNGYQGSSLVTFPLAVRVFGPGTSSPDASINTNYFFSNGSTPTPTQGQGSTSSPGSGTTSAPTPTNNPSPETNIGITILDVMLQSVSSTTASVIVNLSSPGSLRVQYGLSPRNLTEQLNALNQATPQTLFFSDLELNTTYYFRVIATDVSGNESTSDVFTFTTARSEFLPTINTDSFIVTSEKNLIFSFLDKPATGGENIIILPPQTVFEIQFAFEKSESINEVQLIMRPRNGSSNVLGVSSFINKAEASENQTPMLEIKPGVYTGRIQTKTAPGYYEIAVQVHDTNGNIIEEKLADVKISKPFQLLRQGNDDPVENARVYLSLYNERLKLFQEISPEVLPIENPVYSNPLGIVPVVLPPGKYRAVISGLGFEKKQVDFVIGINPNEDYPTVYLNKAPFNLIYGAQYFFATGQDIVSRVSNNVGQVNSSKRLFNFIAAVIVGLFLILTTISLSSRMHTKPHHLPRYFMSLLTLHGRDIEKKRQFQGVVILANTIETIPGVDIFITDHSTGKIVFHTKTNSRGEFIVALPPKDDYMVTLEKLSYHPASIELKLFSKDEVQIFALLKESTKINTLKEDLNGLLHALLSLSFEIFLLVSVIATIILSFSIGFLPVLPFLALAIFNMVFWMLHSIHHNSQ